MTDRELMQQALDALETVFMPHHPAVIALRDRLAKPHIKVEGPLHVVCQCDKCKTQRPWVGLTDDEIEPAAEESDHYSAFHHGVSFAEAKLKEKNCG
jgi:hypothetical protein